MKNNCHGCEGKGWIVYVKQRRVTPFLSNADRSPVEGFAVETSECDVRTCPICSGAGTVAREKAAAATA